MSHRDNSNCVHLVTKPGRDKHAARRTSLKRETGCVNQAMQLTIWFCWFDRSESEPASTRPGPAGTNCVSLGRIVPVTAALAEVARPRPHH
jgi:hypothetical protein